MWIGLKNIDGARRGAGKRVPKIGVSEGGRGGSETGGGRNLR